jgi:hypothetical protein
MDVVVTVPKSFGLKKWIAEGDPAGSEWSGEEWHFYLSGYPPNITPGQRVYVVYNGALRGYAPLVCIDYFEGKRYALVRHGSAVAVTIPEYIVGFRGFRYRWWSYLQERPFPDWQNPSASLILRQVENDWCTGSPTCQCSNCRLTEYNSGEAPEDQIGRD